MENPNSRLEAFCDGVFAIAITLLVIEIRIHVTPEIETNADLWHALGHIAPSIFAFILSFVIILITWVNHHASMKLMSKSSPTFIYANGFLLFTVAFLPFPTSMLGDFLSTNHAAPAVVLYNTTLALQALGWVLITGAALKGKLYKSEKAAAKTRESKKFGYFAFTLYALCAIIAIWFPTTIAIVTTLTWTFWLIWGINIKHEEMN